MAAGSPKDHIEVEWQFTAVDTRPVARWLESAAVPGYTVTSVSEKEMEDRYIDTDDWRLHRAGFTGRVRRKGDGAELTLKSMANAEKGMRSRREVNEMLPSEDVTAIPGDGHVSQMIRSVAGKNPLRELFTVRTKRRTFAVSDAEGIIAEIALDDTSIPVGEDTPVRLSRVEVEVDAAAVERAQRFVDVLVAAAGLVAAGTSKFEAGLIATDQRPPAITNELGSTTVGAGMTAGEVAFAVMRKHFGVFLANEAGTRLGEDIEALHDMRVAARRLRAAMSAFRPYLHPTLQRYRDELGWVARGLGEVRDLDVQLERMEEWRAGFDESQAHALDGVEALLVGRRHAARKRMLVALDSRRYAIFVERFSAVLQRGSARTFAPGREHILSVAPTLLEKRYRTVARKGDKISPASPPSDYHILRIDAKKLRYALEFVGPIYGKPAIEFSQKVTALQDVLGLHQDAEIAIGMLQDMAATAGKRMPPETLMAMGTIAERYRVQAIDLRKQFPGVYRPLRGKTWKQFEKLLEGRRSLAVAGPQPAPAPIRRRTISSNS